MKKHLSLPLLLVLIFIVAVGCEKKDASHNDNSAPQTQEASAAEVKTVDVDLTVLSSTMVYAEVNNILSNPDEYMGKTIKISGPYYASFYDKTGSYYHYVIVEDVAACCAQGLEFVWNGEHDYPGDYPEERTKIEVIGLFGSYDELGQTYYNLAVDEIIIV